MKEIKIKCPRIEFAQNGLIVSYSEYETYPEDDGGVDERWIGDKKVVFSSSQKSEAIDKLFELGKLSGDYKESSVTEKEEKPKEQPAKAKSMEAPTTYQVWLGIKKKGPLLAGFSFASICLLNIVEQRLAPYNSAGFNSGNSSVNIQVVSHSTFFWCSCKLRRKAWMKFNRNCFVGSFQDVKATVVINVSISIMVSYNVVNLVRVRCSIKILPQTRR